MLITYLVVDVCILERETGPCLERLLRFAYDPKSGDCHLFVYGGCKGNGNNFASKRDCLRVCKPRTTENRTADCFPERVKGGRTRCSGTIGYNFKTNNCENVVNGCFHTARECEQACVSKWPPEVPEMRPPSTTSTTTTTATSSTTTTASTTKPAITTTTSTLTTPSVPTTTITTTTVESTTSATTLTTREPIATPSSTTTRTSSTFISSPITSTSSSITPTTEPATTSAGMGIKYAVGIHRQDLCIQSGLKGGCSAHWGYRYNATIDACQWHKTGGCFTNEQECSEACIKRTQTIESKPITTTIPATTSAELTTSTSTPTPTSSKSMGSYLEYHE
ncbi:unnamed protein product [Cylicocyclus nassatus]|uniref:BPTI/Kunitz inhibitor domain-containing protein n=1 Tax=Cylicocyclus nassatus TaxID=53992 RepID=A0AA36HCX0_CYLNA|nr:unnamed protein product [Cylicocyclus nassatus]